MKLFIKCIWIYFYYLIWNNFKWLKVRTNLKISRWSADCVIICLKIFVLFSIECVRLKLALYFFMIYSCNYAHICIYITFILKRFRANYLNKFFPRYNFLAKIFLLKLIFVFYTNFNIIVLYSISLFLYFFVDGRSTSCFT